MSSPVPVYFSLGSNLGDRSRNLRQALSLLEKALGVRPEAVSSEIETAAHGFIGPDFLNICARFDVEIGPEEVLAAAKAVENGMGRPQKAPQYDARGERIYESRIIDVDVLLYGKLTVNTPQLQIPHPRMRERDFVMIPLREIFPDFD